MFFCSLLQSIEQLFSRGPVNTVSSRVLYIYILSHPTLYKQYNIIWTVKMCNQTVLCCNCRMSYLAIAQNSTRLHL